MAVCRSAEVRIVTAPGPRGVEGAPLGNLTVTPSEVRRRSGSVASLVHDLSRVRA